MKKTGNFTFTPSEQPTTSITITKQEIQKAKAKYSNTSSNNQFAVALELAWRKYKNQGSNYKGGNYPEVVFEKFFGLNTQSYTDTLSPALDDLKNNADKSGLLGVFANKGEPYAHAVAIRFDIKKNMYAVTNSSLPAGIANTSKDKQAVIYFSKDEILKIAYDMTIVSP
jgi:adenine-specific DNA methylase